MAHNHCRGCETSNMPVPRAKGAVLSVSPRADLKGLVGDCSRPEPEGLFQPYGWMSARGMYDQFEDIFAVSLVSRFVLMQRWKGDTNIDGSTILSHGHLEDNLWGPPWNRYGHSRSGPFEYPEISTTFLTSIWTAKVKYEGFEDHSTQPYCLSTSLGHVPFQPWARLSCKSL